MYFKPLIVSLAVLTGAAVAELAPNATPRTLFTVALLPRAKPSFSCTLASLPIATASVTSF